MLRVIFFVCDAKVSPWRNGMPSAVLPWPYCAGALAVSDPVNRTATIQMSERRRPYRETDGACVEAAQNTYGTNTTESCSAPGVGQQAVRWATVDSCFLMPSVFPLAQDDVFCLDRDRPTVLAVPQSPKRRGGHEGPPATFHHLRIGGTKTYYADSRNPARYGLSRPRHAGNPSFTL